VKKVYIVTAGEYSDYHIVGVFDIKELAEAFCRKTNFPPFYPAEVEEWEVNNTEYLKMLDFDAWRVYLNGEGEITGVEKISFDEYLGHMEWSQMEGSPGMLTFRYPEWVEVFCLAKDREHAVKIASERFMKFKAMKEGIA